MTTPLFIAFVVIMAAAVSAVLIRYAGRRGAGITVGTLVVWLGYVALLSYLGVFANAAMHPPGILFLFVPAVMLVTFTLTRLVSRSGARLVSAIPLWILVGAQTFRVGVEIFIHRLWIEGLVPKMLTFSGANVDIYLGASAPIIAWLAARKASGRKLVLVWNMLGLLALANVVVRAIGTTAGPAHFIDTTSPNRMIGTFPYTFIPGFFVPLAAILHVLAMRACLRPSMADLPGSVAEFEAGSSRW